MTSQSPASHWLHQYGNKEGYEWRTLQTGGKIIFYQPLGLCEFSYNSEARQFEGEMDLSNFIEVEIRSTLTPAAFRERIQLVWACLRCRHPLLRSRTVRGYSLKTFAPGGMHFQVDALDSLQEAQENARQHITFLTDYFKDVDTSEFYYHCQNTARILDPDVSSSTLFVYPEQTSTDGLSRLRFLFIGAHCVWDALTTYAWNRDFVQLLNDPLATIQNKIEEAIKIEHLARSLPLPQEAFYPPISGSVARQRWFWAIVRILRHVRRPLRPSIPDPLYRRENLPSPVHLNPIFHPLLPYHRNPVRNTQTFDAIIPLSAARHLHRICVETGTSIGAGCFALVALVSMELHEALATDTRNTGHPTKGALDSTNPKDFVARVPLDVRAFLANALAPENMMLAFCEGIELPILPMSLSLVGRLRLLARRAHAELGAYRKRKRSTNLQQVQRDFMTSRGAGLVLANEYLAGVEAAEQGFTVVDLQGHFPIQNNPTDCAHAISSVGRRDLFLSRGTYLSDYRDRDIAAEFVDTKGGPRARRGLLVGIGGFEDGIFVSAVADMSMIDPTLAEKWRFRMEHILDELDDVKEAKL